MNTYDKETSSKSLGEKEKKMNKEDERSCHRFARTHTFDSELKICVFEERKRNALVDR